MSGQPPPPYDEVAAEDRATLGPPSKLVVRLQVWHYRSEGRSPLNNDGLATLFRDHNVQAWEVAPFEADGVTGLSSHDQYVPVEVQFRHRVWAHNDPGEHPMADVRELFFKVAPQFIYQFFIRIKSTPHNLNIFPVGVPENFISRYTRGYNLNQLSIRVNTFPVPGPARTNDVQTWLQDAVSTTGDVLEILAAIGDRNGQAGIQQEARDANVLNVDVPQQLGELRTLFAEFRRPNGHLVTQPPVQLADLQVELNRAAGPLSEYLRLANRMESRLAKLENNLTISNQDLYELVQDAHNGVILFSTLKQAVKPLIRQLETNYSTVIRSYEKNKLRWIGATGAIAAVAIFCFWNPVGWTAVAYIVGGVGGGAAGSVGHSKWDAEGEKALGKKDRVREFTLAIKAVDECANQAREAIATVFCAQVMQKRLDESLPEHDRGAILATLGVDVDAVSDSVYSQELIRDRVTNFREKNRNLGNVMDRVREDANVEVETEVETTEQAM
ncbi:hypothetical protein FLAG1_09622 [Fusarium langsethiae]|uniref:Uncharacterized protein n=1 Tax=Fusarium langsethiae TaxID=179993 RepID=A0A0M9EQJ2_FUSLA|nr:hypothetical protein FLAG1_09622 [Fusarium langsethiae]GKU08292.1 unnamed protein product [Fusarium langsethiae]